MFVEQMLPRARERLATIGAAASVKEAAALMSGSHIDLVVVCGHDGGMVGVISKTDLVRQMGQCAGDGSTARVDTIMTRDVISCGSGDALQDIWATMNARALQRIPIVDRRGKPIGIAYARDTLLNLLGEVENEEALLRDYVMGVGYR